MSLFEQLRFAFVALSSHRLRTMLCLLGISIGVTAVVLLTSLGEGARRYVDDQFRSLGSNLILIIPGHSETADAQKRTWSRLSADVNVDLDCGDSPRTCRSRPDPISCGRIRSRNGGIRMAKSIDWYYHRNG